MKVLLFSYILYSRKVWWVESSANLVNCLRFTKLVSINNPLADLFIHQTFFCQALEKIKFAKHSPHQTFRLYRSFMKTTINVLTCITIDNCLCRMWHCKHKFSHIIYVFSLCNCETVCPQNFHVQLLWWLCFMLFS